MTIRFMFCPVGGNGSGIASPWLLLYNVLTERGGGVKDQAGWLVNFAGGDAF
jgi:hypothetical protein